MFSFGSGAGGLTLGNSPSMGSSSAASPSLSSTASSSAFPSDVFVFGATGLDDLLQQHNNNKEEEAEKRENERVVSVWDKAELAKKFKHSIGLLFNNPQHSDIVFTFPDSEEKIYAQKAVLRVWSEYWDKMFSGLFKESSQSSILITDTDHATLSAALKFLYTGQITLSDNNIWTLFELARMYWLQLLEEVCLAYLQSSLGVHNVLTVLRFAERHYLEGLQEECVRFLAGHVGTFDAQPERREEFVRDMSKHSLRALLHHIATFREYSCGTPSPVVLLSLIYDWCTHRTFSSSSSSSVGDAGQDKEAREEDGAQQEREKLKSAHEENEEEEEENGKKRKRRSEDEEPQREEKERKKRREETLQEKRDRRVSSLLELMPFDRMSTQELERIEQEPKYMSLPIMPIKLMQAWKAKARVSLGFSPLPSTSPSTSYITTTSSSPSFIEPDLSSMQFTVGTYDASANRGRRRFLKPTRRK
ncbi:Pentatricopeptide repeat-containing protein [Balamuthia mandrillaris]